jgi:hypothetical protein
VQYLPDWLPFQGYKAVAAKFRKTNESHIHIPHRFVKDEIVSRPSLTTRFQGSMLYQAAGTAAPNFTTRILETKLTPEELEVVPWISTALYAGGQDTVRFAQILAIQRLMRLQVSAALGIWFVAMVLYPDVQRKAQEEIDGVVGKYRLPTMDDFDNLPYLKAVLKESMRWHPVASMSTHLAAIHSF